MSDEMKPPRQEPEPRIIVDDDWKAQARAEKARLAEEQERAKAKGAKDSAGAPAPGPAAAGRPAGGRRELPPASFATHLSTLASQAFFALGAVADPQSRQRVVDLDLAKFHIDTLRMLEEKTAGNLSDEEKSLLDGTLYELRTHFIHVAQQSSLI